MRRLAAFVPAMLLAVGIGVAFTDNGAHRLARFLGAPESDGCGRGDGHCGCPASRNSCDQPCSACCSPVCSMGNPSARR